MKREEAEEFTSALDGVVSGAWRLVGHAHRQGIPKALGYATTREWVIDRLGAYVRLSIEERREAVAELTADGMSTREIADIVGVGKSTVERDIAGPDGPPHAPDQDLEVGSGPDGPPESRYPELANVPPERRPVIAAELDGMGDDERAAALTSLETADVVYSTQEREVLLNAMPLPRLPRDLHDRALRLIPKHREAVLERIEQIDKRLAKARKEVGG